MNIILPTPAEMPARLYDLMVHRFQHELVCLFTNTDTALNAWFNEKLEGRTVLRATITFDYDMAVEGEHLPKVMDLMVATVRRAGWFVEQRNASLDLCEIAFSELTEQPDEDDGDADESEDAGMILRMDSEGTAIEPDETGAGPDVDDEDDEGQVQINDDSETELEFEDDDDEDEIEDDEDEASDDDESEPEAPEENPLVAAITKFGDAIADGPIEWVDIVELDGTTVVLELLRDGNELEIEVAAKYDAAPNATGVVYHVTPPNKTTLQFVSLNALIAYLTEAYGDASKP